MSSTVSTIKTTEFPLSLFISILSPGDNGVTDPPSPETNLLSELNHSQPPTITPPCMCGKQGAGDISKTFPLLALIISVIIVPSLIPP